MKKIQRNIILFFMIVFCFIINIDFAKALNECNIGDGNSSRGYGTVTQEYTEANAGQSASIYIDSPSGNSDFSLSKGWSKSSWDEKREFSIYFASPKSGSKIGTIKTFNMTFYDDDGNALCELTNENWGPEAVGQQYAIFSFNITSGHISEIKATGSYDYDGKSNDFKGKTFHIGKKKGNTGSVSNTTTTKKTSVGETTTTKTKRTVEDATPENVVPSSSYAKGTKSPNLVGDSKKVGCDSGDGDTTISELIEKYWSWIMILAPVALMLLISIDFVKAIMSSDADMLKKSSYAALKRTIAVVVLLMLPVILNLLLGWFGIEFCI